MRLFWNAEGTSEAELLSVAAAVEGSTRHPVADAVLAAAQQRGQQAHHVHAHWPAGHLVGCQCGIPGDDSLTVRHTTWRTLKTSRRDIHSVWLCCEHPGRAVPVATSDSVPSSAGLEPPQLADAFTEAGEGVRGRIGGRRVAAGRREWVAGVIGRDATAAAQQAGSEAESAATVVWVGQEGRGIIGSLAFRDSLR